MVGSVSVKMEEYPSLCYTTWIIKSASRESEIEEESCEMDYNEIFFGNDYD